MGYSAVFLCSVALTFALIPFCIKLARTSDFLDYPSALKIHGHPTPLLGGVAVFVGFWVAVLLGLVLFRSPFSQELIGILVGGAAVAGLGLIDDKRSLSPSYKLLGQVIAAVLFLTISNSTRILTGSSWDVLILILWIVGLINAVNFLDAMDGLCAGISFISAGAFLVIAIFDHQTYSAILTLALMGGLLGFLRYNWTPAKIFLGDAGSMFNGFILACLGILFAHGNPSYSSLLVPIVILSYPIFDITFVTLIRLREGRKVYVGDYNNSPRRIASLGMQNTGVVLWIYLFCFLLGGLGILLHFFFESPLRMLVTVFVWLFLVIFGVHLQRNFVNVWEKLILVLSDVIMINAAFLFFLWVKFHSGLFVNPWIIPLSEYAAPAIWITIFWINLFAVLGLYEVSGDSRFRDDLKATVKALGVGIVLFLVLTLDPAYLLVKSWILLSIYALVLASGLVLGRGLVGYLARNVRFLGLGTRRALIVGTGNTAKCLLQKLIDNPGYGYQVMGLMVAYGENPVSSSSPSKTQILGDLDDLDEVARVNKIQDILIAVEPDWKGSLQEIMNSVHNLEISFKVVSGLDRLTRGYHTVPLRTEFLSRIFPSQMRTWEWLIKRVFDGLVSLVLLILLSPVWLLLALLVFLKFKAKPIVRHRYLGKTGRPLEVYHFRVSADSPKASEPENEPVADLTSLGRFLRGSGLEKIPALINILKGQMSLVGPEPLSGSMIQNLSNGLPLLPKRLNVKPGLVSLAQVQAGSGGYEQAAEDCLRNDLYYLEHMSLLLDLRIIIKRFASVFAR
jgi:UDP-GlcNAc:undecaprenyl-phosphate GlcNAc-1-phosphate transferase